MLHKPFMYCILILSLRLKYTMRSVALQYEYFHNNKCFQKLRKEKKERRRKKYAKEKQTQVKGKGHHKSRILNIIVSMYCPCTRMFHFLYFKFWFLAIYGHKTRFFSRQKRDCPRCRDYGMNKKQEMLAIHLSENCTPQKKLKPFCSTIFCPSYVKLYDLLFSEVESI